MLENHSFDNIFAMSGIPNIQHATTSDSNSYNGTPYAVRSPAPPAMPTDPGHEFLDVLEQLCGQGATHTPWTPYPQPINNSGFVANYATTRTEITSNNPNLPTPAQYDDVMQCFDTKSQLPVTYQLATQFAVCDHWFSSHSRPDLAESLLRARRVVRQVGPTAPPPATIAMWDTPGGGFAYPSGSSIYDAAEPELGCSGASTSTRTVHCSAGFPRLRP